MIKFAAAFLLAAVSAGRLENNYLPPSSAHNAGGNGNNLQTPFSANGGFGNGEQRVSGHGILGSGPARINPNDAFGNGLSGNGANAAVYNGGQPASDYGAPSSNGVNPASDSVPSVSGSTRSTFNGAVSSSTKNGNGLAPVYGVPSQNGIHAGEYRNQVFGSGAAPVDILRYNSQNNGDGSYSFEYETENHISQQESGELKNGGTAGESSVVRGTYSYAGPDGRTYTVNYIADENGFQPTGEHIHLAVQAAAAEAARTSSAEIKSGGYQAADGINGNGKGYQY